MCYESKNFMLTQEAEKQKERRDGNIESEGSRERGSRNQRSGPKIR